MVTGRGGGGSGGGVTWLQNGFFEEGSREIFHNASHTEVGYILFESLGDPQFRTEHDER